MSKPEKSPGTTDLSSNVERFDAHTASIPDVLSAEDPEILPPGAAEPAETGWPISEVETIVGVPFFFLKKRYGEQWELADDEAAHLAKVWKPILDRYLPTEETELGTALLVTLVLCAPRAMETDWSKGKTSGKNLTPPANTKTAVSTASPATSASANPEKAAEWDVMSAP